MNNRTNKILYAFKDNVCIIKLIGDLRYTISNGFHNLVSSTVKDDAVKNFILKFEEADYLDSTNLGIIGMIAAGLRKRGGSAKPRITGPKKDVETILKSMGFDLLFEITPGSETPNDLNYSDTEELKRKDKSPREYILESHQTLTEINQSNREKFAPVVEAILKKRKSDQPL